MLLVLYNVRTRALHRHPPYLEMWEWLWWTGLITFSLIIVEALFVFDFFLVLLTEIIGIGTLVWIRFLRFPPILAAYEHKLARERYYTQAEVRGPGGDDPPARRRAEARARPAPPALAGDGEDGPMPIEIRRFGVGHRRPEGPPGTVGLTGQPIHSDGRGVDRRARVRPRARASSRTPTRTRPGSSSSRAAAGSASATSGPGSRPARPCSGRRTSRTRAWTEHSEMRAFVVEFTGPDDPSSRGCSRVGRSRSIRRAASPERRGIGALAERPVDPGDGPRQRRTGLTTFRRGAVARLDGRPSLPRSAGPTAEPTRAAGDRAERARSPV